jgi:mannitol-1-/sugar-/sorbitol-6-/2-deoxyglucose-6-phosphatase
MGAFDAAIFDMDGLLIDSEPLWQQAEINCFRPLGVPITAEICMATAGRRLDEVLAHWYERFGWEGPGIGEMHQRVLEEVTRLMMAHGEPLPGVHQQMAALKQAGLKLAIASSSPPSLIEAVVAKLELADYLTLTHSGTHEARGKPDPAVFLTTARRLAVEPARCLVFEDAPAGVEAGHRAGMHVIAIPSVFEPSDPGFGLAQQVLNSLEDFCLSGAEQLAARH